MPEFNIEEHKKWYESQRPTYDLLSNTVKNTLESLIKNAGIEYLNITFRAKEIDSFVEKINRKTYTNPTEEITDLAGIRVITFIESDAIKVNKLIKKSFKVDESKSLDKSDELGIDKFGYRSFHFICGLGEERCKLPEFEIFKDLICEIQVRTVLQHAWAEIEHDRNYKFAGDLPKQIKRRLHLLAGLLEIADGEFNKLSGEIDNYSENISEKFKSGNLDVEINSITLERYFKESETVKFITDAGEEAGFVTMSDFGLPQETLIKFCKDYNINKIEEIETVLKSSISWAQDYLSELRKSYSGPVGGNINYYMMMILVCANRKDFNFNHLIEYGFSDGVIEQIKNSAANIKDN
jgi:ppGpp synthetase/RelA/SpoT-type nucleotidyltranferase